MLVARVRVGLMEVPVAIDGREMENLSENGMVE